jgi:hypothetical protein
MLAASDKLSYRSEIWTLTGKYKEQTTSFLFGLFYDSVSIPECRAPTARMNDE